MDTSSRRWVAGFVRFGLVIAAIGLLSAKGTTTLYVPPEDVALVNQVPIVHRLSRPDPRPV